MIYTIREGHHSCSPRPWGIGFDSHYSKIVKFNSSAMYYFDSKEDQFDINKLWGRGFMNGDSARFGWRWWEGKIDILAYVHDGSLVTKDRLIKSVHVNQEYRLDLYINKNSYTFKIDGKDDTGVLKHHNRHASYPMDFWFGGTQVAPQDITVELN